MAVLNLRPLLGGRLVRGSQPFGMDAAATAEFLAAHGIRTVVDLRSVRERDLLPWQLAQGNGVELLESPFDTAPHGLPPVVGTAEELGELYLGWVRTGPAWVAASLRPAAHGTAFVHCSLGKDRTGVISALALLAAGTDPEAVVADYTATTAALPQLLTVMAQTWSVAVPALPPQAFSPEHMLLQSPEGAIRHFLAGFGREFGDAAGYLRDAGLSAAELDALRGPAA
ncbi:tyrosine-protein phosphatase [Arthrobacter celericrescens]|uniref:tyrosine-protein phosphatase n=1 Tax=Arthrobacter celericrescens TaxID=2320851 RepID=UPI000EA0BDB4|nr:tyrosine-protein phosphatase [Arthrobacter celericrescens]